MKKFLDPNLKNKSKTVEEKIQLYEYNKISYPLPTEIEISELRSATESAHFVLEVTHLL